MQNSLGETFTGLKSRFPFLCQCLRISSNLPYKSSWAPVQFISNPGKDFKMLGLWIFSLFVTWAASQQDLSPRHAYYFNSDIKNDNFRWVRQLNPYLNTYY